MRVLQVMEATIGGTRRHLVDVARGLRRAGVDVHVAASAEREPDFRADLEALAREGCGVLELPMRREIAPRADLSHLLRLRRLVAELEPDVVHTHSSKAGVLGRLASLSTGVGARVHTPHTFAFLFGAMFGPRKRALFRRIETALGRRTDRVVAVSESEGATIRGSGVVDPDRVRVVPNAVDPGPWTGAEPASRAALGASPDRVLGAVVGLLNAAKGQDVALRALAEPGLEEVELLFVGHGEDGPALQRLAAELGVADRSCFLGWRRDVPSLLAACDFLLLPSRWEGMPYVVLEAMAAGLPVVATAVDGARDLVRSGETGFLAEPEHAGDLARAVRELLALDPGRRAALGTRARERVHAEFTLERMVERLIDVYAELL